MNKLPILKEPFFWLFWFSMFFHFLFLVDNFTTPLTLGTGHTVDSLGAAGIKACLVDYDKLYANYSEIVEIIQTRCACANIEE